MAKIDVTKIEGYGDMTPEEKLAALESFEYDDNMSEVTRYKNAVSKASSEAAEWKRKHNALLSEEEQKRNEEAEELNSLREQLATMKKDQLVANHKSQYLAMGYDEALANETAKAMVDGDTDKVFANQRKFLETHDKNFKAELLKDTPKPPAGGGTDEVTMDKFRKMTPSERYEFSVKNPQEYKKLYGGND